MTTYSAGTRVKTRIATGRVTRCWQGRVVFVDQGGGVHNVPADDITEYSPMRHEQTPPTYEDPAWIADMVYAHICYANAGSNKQEWTAHRDTIADGLARHRHMDAIADRLEGMACISSISKQVTETIEKARELRESRAQTGD